MPSPTGRRHPLFHRFQKPVDSIYPDPVTPVAWDDYEPIEKAEGVVYIATRPCAKLRTWASQLRKLHAADETHKTDVSISFLGLQPIRAKGLAKVGQWELELWNHDCSPVRTGRRAQFVCATVTQIAVILDRLDGHAVGFVSFEIKWVVGATVRGEQDLDLNVEYDQAWMAPEYRYRGWASTAAIAISFAVKRHVDQVAATTRWPKDFTAQATLTVGADIYSSSGERFLQSCAQYMSFQFELPEGEGSRIEMVEMELESRW